MAVSKNVTVIPARKHTRKSKDEEKPKLRVAAYCRVSTDSEEQATSYDTQIEHYTAYIQGHPDWMLAGIFADDGISGTNTKKREEFNRMIDECMVLYANEFVTKKDKSNGSGNVKKRGCTVDAHPNLVRLKSSENPKA